MASRCFREPSLISSTLNAELTTKTRLLEGNAYMIMNQEKYIVREFVILFRLLLDFVLCYALLTLDYFQNRNKAKY